MGILDNFTDAFKDPFGTGAANDANAANAQRYKRAIGLWDQLQGQQQTAYGAAGGYLSHLLPTINKGYGQARQGLQAAGQSAKQGIQDRGQQQIAGTAQSLASRGLYNTTALDAAQRGVHADTSRALASVDESLGQLMSGLSISQSQAQAGAYGALSNFEQQRYGSLADIYRGKIGTISSREDVVAPSLLSQLGPLVGAAMGGL